MVLSEQYEFISNNGKYIGIRMYYNYSINLYLNYDVLYELIGVIIKKESICSGDEIFKKADRRYTVLKVQVQNKPGAWGSVRDYSVNA